jgi:glucose-1-phosphate adenylyltransferase
MAEPRILGIVLAGGEGKRLAPLTLDRAKPAVPFAGLYRLIDFALSNLVNAGVLKIAVLTQYKSHSLDRHITTTWRLSNLLGNYVTPVPAQQRLGPQWYTGSANAIFQSLNLVYDERPDIIVVFGADHVYRMDPRQMIDQHIDGGAGVTVAGIPVPQREATAFGVIQTADDGAGSRRSSRSRPTHRGSPGAPTRPTRRWATTCSAPRPCSTRCTPTPRTTDSKHDMGGNIVPMLTGEGAAQVYDFRSNVVPGETPGAEHYWRDVGTIDSYFEAHMDLCATVPRSTSTTDRWPILTHIPSQARRRSSCHDDAKNDRIGRRSTASCPTASSSRVASVRESVLSPGCTCTAGRRSSGRCSWTADRRPQRGGAQRDPRQERAGRRRGGDRRDKDDDRARGFVVSAEGVTVVGKG